MKFLYVILAIMLLNLAACDLEQELDDAIIDISGTVSNAGSAVSGVIVLLVEDVQVSEGLNLANGSITTSNGQYLILDVDPGVYYVLAVDDSDGNLEFDPAIDRLGFHGVDPDNMDLIPDQITVLDNDIEDIDIDSLYSL
ncbi:MAG: carboxypeptidase-like regulatory domain-containing protein [Candidatus Marinimicrobia bacterium]|nr:carboxypeptidase-like regulatory domain-containing protein [Candidatus Neomarinimicrobiota bacterium]